MNNKGFTLVEAMIGILVLAVLMLGLSNIFDSTLKKKKKLQDKSLFDNSFKGFGQRWQQLLKGGDVASTFQMLPVRYKNCTSDGPCFFSMDNKGIMGNLSRSDLGGLGGVNFFNDSGIRVYKRPLLKKNDSARIIYFKRPRYSLEVKRSRGKRYFVGWKLKGLKTSPFTMLSRSDFPGYFQFPVALGQHDPRTDYIILKGSSKGLPVKNIVNQLMVFYNAYNSKSYFFKQIMEAGVCAPTNICKDLAPDSWVDKPKMNSGKYYYLKIVKPTDLSAFVSGTGVNMVGKWNGQRASEYSFPYQRPTISDPSDEAQDLFDADPRKMQHYSDQKKLDSQIVAVPVSFKKLQLVAQGSKKKKLVMSTFENPSKYKTVLNDLHLDSEVYFSRQLSTNKVSAFVIDGNIKTKPKR
jgi:prepilin-type N-terminal cleavage/methylation domain-containing protein